MDTKRKRVLKKLVVWSDTQILQIILVTIAFLSIILLFVFTRKDVFTLLDLTIISTFLITFFSTLSFNKMIDLFRFHVEDYIKVDYNFDLLQTRYPLDKTNSKFYTDSTNQFYPLIILYQNQHQKKFIIDDKITNYSLPQILEPYSEKILNAHKSTIYKNNLMVRLDEIIEENDTIKLSTSRTTYLDSLLTNRAADYKVIHELSVRDIIDPGPYMQPLSTSQMSNHLGFNILVITKDDYVILTKRNKTVSTAKNKVGFGVSGSLKTKYALDTYNQLTIRGIEDAVKMEVKNELGIDKEYYDFKFINNLHSIYREVYEGGKPHFYFVLYLDMNLNELKMHYKRQKSNSDQDKDSTRIIALKLKEFLNTKLLPITKIKNEENKIITCHFALTTIALMQYSQDSYYTFRMK